MRSCAGRSSRRPSWANAVRRAGMAKGSRGGERRLSRRWSVSEVSLVAAGPSGPLADRLTAPPRGPLPAPAADGSAKTGLVSGGLPSCRCGFARAKKQRLSWNHSAVTCAHRKAPCTARPPSLAGHTNPISSALLTRRVDRPSLSAFHIAARQPSACPRCRSRTISFFEPPRVGSAPLLPQRFGRVCLSSASGRRGPIREAMLGRHAPLRSDALRA